MENNNKKEEQPLPKKKRVLRIVSDVIFFSIIGIFVSYFLVNAIDQHTGYNLPFFGYRNSVIVSDSMSSVSPENDYITEEMQQLQKYDVITTKTYKSYDDIKLYDILTYSNGKTLVCHRVVDKYTDNGVNYVVTRGDANNVDDTPVAYKSVKGKVIKVTHKVGYLVLFFQSGYISLAIFGSLFFFFLGMYIYDHEMDKKKAEEQKVVAVMNQPSKDGIECEAIPLETTQKPQKKKKIKVEDKHE